MTGERRWSVTYTKHVKQKRKVYQDGYVLVSNNKVMLYNDAEELLDSKFLKKDEAIRPGQALALASYLVDIGDPKTDHKPMPSFHSQFQEDDNRVTERVELPQGNNSMIRNYSHGRRNVLDVGNSPSQNIIKEFKKSEMLKYGIQQSPPAFTSPTMKEWQVLYTTQLTQKAKKYHDGTIQVITCGSQGRQIKLYDAHKNLLESRFLKKAEVIKSDESLRFTAHLVDIGDPLVNHENLVEFKGSNTGVSTVATSLPNSEGSKLSQDHFVADNTVSIGAQKQDACSRVEDSSKLRNLAAEKSKSGDSLPATKPLRDACGILSFLRKSVAAENGLGMSEAAVKQSHPLYSEAALPDIEDKDQNATGHVLDLEHQSSCTAQPNNDNRSLKEELTGKNCRTGNIIELLHNHADSSCEAKKENIHDVGRVAQPKNRKSVDLPSGFTKASKLKMVMNADCGPSVMDSRKTSTERSSHTSSRPATGRVSLVPATVHNTSFAHGDSLMFANMTDRRDHLPRMSLDDGKCQRFSLGHEAALRSGEKATSFSKNSQSEDVVSQNIRDAEGKISMETRPSAKVDDCPNFDLGF